MYGIDIETTALDPADGKLSLMQVFDPKTKRVWVYDAINGLPPQPGKPFIFSGKWKFNGDGPREWCPDEAIRGGVAHNVVFEERWLREYGYDARLEDTMIASQVFYTGTNAAPGKLTHSLASCVSRELKRELPKDEQMSDWSHRPLTRQQLEYAARDAIILPELYERLMTKVEKAGLRDVYDLEVRVGRAVDEMERNGFAVHEDELDALIADATRTAEDLKAELTAEWDINPGSSKQLREHFHLDEREGWPKTPAGAPKTDQDAMQALIDEPGVQKWVEWKRVEKLRSTYGKSLQKQIVEGRIHARFNPFGAGTGRFSSSGPNLQNIPKDERYRSLFWAGAEDRVLIKADYASIELWVAAILWDDPHMQHALQQGVNMHVATAAALFNVKAGEVTKEQNSRTHYERFPGLDRGLKALLRYAEYPVLGRGEPRLWISGFFRRQPANVSKCK